MLWLEEVQFQLGRSSKKVKDHTEGEEGKKKTKTKTSKVDT